MSHREAIILIPLTEYIDTVAAPFWAAGRAAIADESLDMTPDEIAAWIEGFRLHSAKPPTGKALEEALAAPIRAPRRITATARRGAKRNCINRGT